MEFTLETRKVFGPDGKEINMFTERAAIREKCQIVEEKEDGIEVAEGKPEEEET